MPSDACGNFPFSATRLSALAAAQRCSGARAITAQRSPSTTCSGTGMAALELSQQSLTRGAGTGAARRAPSHCRQCSGPWQRWQQRSQYCAAELSLAQAASYASCGAAVTAALEPHWRSVRTSARASAAGGQHQWPAGSAPTVPRREIERESGHKRRREVVMIDVLSTACHECASAINCTAWGAALESGGKWTIARPRAAWCSTNVCGTL